MDLGIEVSVSQHLHITPDLKLGIQIMAMSSAELQGFLAGAMAENPFLTSADPDDASSRPFDGLSTPSAQPTATSVSRTHPSTIRNATFTAGDLLNQVPQQEASLEERLFEQLRLELRRNIDLCIAYHLLRGLDSRGYLFTDVSVIAAGLGVSPDHVEWVLKKLQTECTPAGIGARSLEERLLAQLESLGEADSLAYRVISDHLEELAQGRFASIAEKLQVPLADVKDVFVRIRKLDPNPANVASGQRRSITPEMKVVRSEGQWKVQVKEEAFPQVIMDRALAEAIDPKAMDQQAAKRMMALMRSAEGIVRAVDLRRGSLISVAAAVVDAQAGFFEAGPAGMRPLTMAEVAQAAGVSESTVSRIAQHAYLETPYATLPLRGFFTSGVGGHQTSDGEDASAIAVKQAIRTLVDAEDKAKPLSDAQIVDALEARGMHVSRRTVNKYRTALGILSRSKRKEY